MIISKKRNIHGNFGKALIVQKDKRDFLIENIFKNILKQRTRPTIQIIIVESLAGMQEL